MTRPTRKTRWIAILSSTLLAIALAATAAVSGSAEKNLVETAAEAGSFETLLAAAKAAGLAGALQSDGPFTVFAPTDEAFAKLPHGTVETLLKPANRDRLKAILTYHVVPTELSAEEVVRFDRVETLNGQRPDVTVRDGRVRIGGASLVATDIAASNGTIHVVDTVMLPAEDDLVDTARNAGGFETLVAALKAAGLVDALRGEGPLTVFAPTDEAFAKLPEGTVENLLRPENRDRLRAILTYHVVPGAIYGADVESGRVETLEGSALLAAVGRGAIRIDDATVVAADVVASNGVIHVIDEVVLPERVRASLTDPVTDLLTTAIDRGVPLFNGRQPEACAAVYEIAAKGLLGGMDYALSRGERRTLERALREAGRTHDASEQAWVLRYAFDDVLASRR